MNIQRFAIFPIVSIDTYIMAARWNRLKMSQHRNRSLTLSVREPNLCLCKQVGSNLFATQSIIPHKKQAEFTAFKKQMTK